MDKKPSWSSSNSNSDIGGKAFNYREKEVRRKESSRTRLGSSTSRSRGDLEELPLFRDTPVSQREQLLRHKLRQCSMVFDFTDESVDVRPKEQKRATLEELHAYFNSNKDALKPELYSDYFHMISRNIFRSFPYTEQKEFDPEDDEPFIDPATCHLELVYQVFILILKSAELDVTVAKEFVNQRFMISLLQLFDTEDSNEREYLKVILHRIYLKFISLRPFIRQQINNIFLRFVYEVERFSGIKELLDLMCGIIDGFMIPLKPEHVNFLTRVLLPLHKPKQYIQYFNELILCIENFIAKDASLAAFVVESLQRYWPKTFSSKEALFLVELERIITVLDAQHVQSIILPSFKIISKCFNSPHFQVAEKSLMVFANPAIIVHIKANMPTVGPVVYPEVVDVSHNHWHPAITALAGSVLHMLTELNPKLVESLANSAKQDKKREKKKPKTIDEAWKRAEEKLRMQAPKKTQRK